MPVANEKRKWPTSDKQDVAHFSSYVTEICSEFSAMAEAAQLPMLSYLLGMARDEAARIANVARHAETKALP